VSCVFPLMEPVRLSRYLFVDFSLDAILLRGT
jgi:hypothetical protein